MVDPTTIDIRYGLVLRAMSFIAGYGICVTVATDKLVVRMLDNFAVKHKVQCHPLVGTYNTQPSPERKSIVVLGLLTIQSDGRSMISGAGVLPSIIGAVLFYGIALSFRIVPYPL